MVLAPSIQFSAFKEAPPSPEPSVLLWEHPTPNLSSPLHLLSRCWFPGSLLQLLLAQCLPRVPSNGTRGIAPRAGQSQGHWTTHYLMTFSTRSRSSTAWLSAFRQVPPGVGCPQNHSEVRLAGHDLDILHFLKQPMPGFYDAIGRANVPGHGKC